MAKKSNMEVQMAKRQSMISRLKGRIARIDEYIKKRLELRNRAIARRNYYIKVRQEAVAKGRPHKTADRVIETQERKIRTYNAQGQQAVADRKKTIQEIQLVESGQKRYLRQTRRYAVSVRYDSANSSKRRDIEVAFVISATKQLHQDLLGVIPDAVRLYLREFYNPDYFNVSDVSEDFDFYRDAPSEEEMSNSNAIIVQLQYTDRRNRGNNREYPKRSIQSTQEMLSYSSEMGGRE